MNSALTRLAPALLAALVGSYLAAPLVAKEPTPGEQVERSTAVSDKTTLRYWLYLPAGYKQDEGEKWPLLLFLHGAGERGDDLAAVKKHGPPKLIEEGKSLPMIVVSPQCPSGGRWNAAELAKLVDELANTYRVDRNRLYVTGLSMGGAGTWALLSERPGMFAAAIPICGGVEAEAAAKLTDTPIWIVVGAKDRPELVERNRKAIEAIEKAGGKKMKSTIYPDAGHDSWTATYNNPEYFDWMLKQRLGSEK